MMFRKTFLDHPETVGETYTEHFLAAGSFGVAMFVGGVAAMVHAVVPALFEQTGSRTIATLHARMVAKRGAVRNAQAQMKTVDYII
jgi:uncharacterized membrane protein